MIFHKYFAYILQIFISYAKYYINKKNHNSQLVLGKLTCKKYIEYCKMIS